MTTFTNEFSHETWYQKYKFGNDTCIEDTHQRVAENLASVEDNKEKWTEEFLWALDDFKFVPGGRILSNAGTSLTGTTYINCFVDGFVGKDQDSIDGIYNALHRQAKILKSEGGYGFCANVFRPRGAHIGGIANQTPGSVKFLELWDKSSEIITEGSGQATTSKEKNFIRKGAQMVTMSDWHPDIEEFIEAKTVEGQLTKFNMSVLCSDALMKAVEKDDDWFLCFPDYENYAKQYKTDWDGNLDKWMALNGRDSIKIYKTMPARELWDKIMTNAYNRNEPGVLFVDTMNRMNNLWYEEYIMATNPCGEQILPIGAVCLLGSLNLTQFVDVETGQFDWGKLRKTIHIAVRFLDNVNDLTYVPLKEQKDNLKKKRRIGLGVLGYGSALMMLRKKYGSKSALEFTEELMKFISREAYRASINLAKEKGPFELFEPDQFLQSGYVQSVLPDGVKRDIKKYGLRNSHLLSIQPTGNTGVLSNIASGGLEPSFCVPGYYRTSIQPFAPEGLAIPHQIDWKKKTYTSDRGWTWIKEGDESLLATQFAGKTWKYDQNRGLLKEEWVEDYGVRQLKKVGKWRENASWASSAMDLKVDDHVNTMSIFAKYVDSAISKTVNLPNNYSYEGFKDVFYNAWKAGIKGFTVYREGTMAAVLSRNETKLSELERPREVDCDVHHISVKGQPYFVLVGKMEDRPYEVFAGKNGVIENDVKTGTIIKMKRPRQYKAIFDDGAELCPITAMSTDEEEMATRLISIALQAGTELEVVVAQLEKTKGDMTAFSKSICRALKKYIKDGSVTKDRCPECGEVMIRESGCKTCPQCAYSACS